MREGFETLTHKTTADHTPGHYTVFSPNQLGAQIESTTDYHYQTQKLVRYTPLHAQVASKLQALQTTRASYSSSIEAKITPLTTSTVKSKNSLGAKIADTSGLH